MYALMQDGVVIGWYETLKACQAAAEAMQYCMFTG